MFQWREIVENILKEHNITLDEAKVIKGYLDNIDEITPLIIIKNPNQEELINFLNNTQYKEIRGLIINNDIFIWDSSKAIHPKAHMIIIENDEQTFPVKIYHEFYIQKDNNQYIIKTNNSDNLEAMKEILYSKYKLEEDTVKQGNSWTNKGKEGTHGTFKTKKEADAQRKAMFANGYKG